MNIFDPFGPANTFWSLFGYAPLSSGAQFIGDTETAVAHPVDRQRVEEAEEAFEKRTAARLEERFVSTGSQQWLSQRFDAGDDTQCFKIFIPSSYCGQPLPLIVMLHGAQQDPDDFAAGTGMNDVAEDEGYIVVYPEQSESANPLRCWNWFRPANQTREYGETATIAALTRHVMETYNVDGARVYVAGMSAGGAMAVNLAVTHPELYAAAAIHSGIAFGVADEQLSALCAMNDGKGKIRLPELFPEGQTQRTVPLIVFHGDADDTVHPRNGDQIVAMNQMLYGDVGCDEPADSMRIDPEATLHAYTRRVFRDQRGALVGEQWLIHGLDHAWSGGHPDGTYTDLRGPSATREIVRFFRQVSP
ncbi:PHB depolymerase family esterase [Caballeronia arvi]|uniref:PHB depolymerase family esterase n=1 Tax=Caballeronia arvi TaxID=1777135 RepID=A0A158HJJ5_9BURK|nr:PHB depolymerase family esterase [Caballeronia arvi]SAL44131.1 PHB depolymerase family esterase [Caballeronia arvi]